MQRLRDAQRSGDAEDARHAEQPLGAIEFVILAGVDDVEAGGPEGDGGGQPEDPRIERAAHGDPGRRRRDPQEKPSTRWENDVKRLVNE